MHHQHIPTTRLRRVQALLAKARSTDYPAEAEALVAKAHQLIERWAIDVALVDRPESPDDSIAVEALQVSAPYARARVALVSAIAANVRCRVILDGSGPTGIACHLVGRRNDLDYLRATHAVLDAHAMRAMLAADDRGDRPRAFRHAFLMAFAGRIGRRLTEVRQHALSDLSDENRSAVVVATARGDAAVDRAVREHFPHLRRVRTSASSRTGAASGAAAGDRADLGQARLAERRALGAG